MQKPENMARDVVEGTPAVVVEDEVEDKVEGVQEDVVVAVGEDAVKELERKMLHAKCQISSGTNVKEIMKTVIPQRYLLELQAHNGSRI